MRTTLDDTHKCPKCKRPYAVSLNQHSGIYQCVYNDCRWQCLERCKYPECRTATAYPDLDYCGAHKNLADFIKIILESKE